MEEGAEGVSGGRVRKSLFVLLACGLCSFGALVLLVHMPRAGDGDDKSDPLSLTPDPITLPLTSNVRKSQNRRSSEDVCSSASCMKAANTLLSSMNPSVSPCSDFYEYACGGWKRKNPIPPSVSKWSPFGTLDLQTNKVLQEILKEPKKSGDPGPLSQAKDFYKSCSDVVQLERVGLKPVLQILEAYGGWPLLYPQGTWNSSHFNWMKSVADLKRMFGTSAILDIVVNQHVSNPAFSTVHLQQPSLFLPRPYFIQKFNYKPYIHAYRDLILEIATELKSSPALSSYPHLRGQLNTNYVAEKAVEDIIKFEDSLASLTRDGVEVQYGLRNFTATLSLHYLQSIFDNYTNANSSNRLELGQLLDATFASSGVGKMRPGQLVSMSDTNFMGNIFELLSSTSEETLANYLGFRMLGWVVSGSTNRMREIVEKYQKVIYGIKEGSSREYVCASSTEEKFGLALSQPYLQRVKLKDGALTKAGEMMEQVRSSFLNLLESAKWMNESVKGNLRKRARGISPCIGYPPWMEPNGTKFDKETYQTHLANHFKGLDIGTGGYLQKLWKVRSWLTDQRLKLLTQRFVPGCKWTTFPGQVGAFYDIRRQAVNIPIGLLQPPFFYSDVPMSVNFGGFGSILGHEFTHGFTVAGWTENEGGGFSPVGQCLVDQYSRFRVPEADNLAINGALTFDENFPDNGGLAEAYNAYKLYAAKEMEKRTLPGLEKFSQDQLFFLGFANIWCSASRVEGLRDQLLQDHHTPNRYRVLGTLTNSKEFASAFNCPPNSPMNPTKYKKCNAFQI